MSRKEEVKLAIKNELIGQFKKSTGKAGAVISTAWLYDEFLHP